MTIISTIITNDYIVHASDSKITNFSLEIGKTETSQNSRKTKIIKAEKFRGMISFWGLAKYRKGEKDFYMIDWLKTKVDQAQKEMSP